jgi:hypothetical protein
MAPDLRTLRRASIRKSNEREQAQFGSKGAIEIWVTGGITKDVVVFQSCKCAYTILLLIMQSIP